MTSILVKEVLRKAASKIPDDEDIVWGELNQAMSGMTKLMLDTAAESEVERRVGIGLNEHGEERSDHRNGYRSRIVLTSLETIKTRVPRLMGQGFIPSFLDRKVRVVSQVEVWVENAFLPGMGRSRIIRLIEGIQIAGQVMICCGVLSWS